MLAVLVLDDILKKATGWPETIELVLEDGFSYDQWRKELREILSVEVKPGDDVARWDAAARIVAVARACGQERDAVEFGYIASQRRYAGWFVRLADSKTLEAELGMLHPREGFGEEIFDMWESFERDERLGWTMPEECVRWFDAGISLSLSLQDNDMDGLIDRMRIVVRHGGSWESCLPMLDDIELERGIWRLSNRDFERWEVEAFDRAYCYEAVTRLSRVPLAMGQDEDPGPGAVQRLFLSCDARERVRWMANAKDARVRGWFVGALGQEYTQGRLR